MQLAGESAAGDLELGGHLETCAACREATAAHAVLWDDLGAMPDAKPGPMLQARFDAITKMALATESKMLGEQFDEKNQKWLSAMPLVWSEAAYVRNALALYQ